MANELKKQLKVAQAASKSGYNHNPNQLSDLQTANQQAGNVLTIWAE